MPIYYELDGELEVSMRKSSAVAVSTLAIAIVAVMVFSPLGSPLLQGAENDVSQGLQNLGYALGAIFPAAVQVGPVSASTQIAVGVALPLQNQAGLDSFVQSVSTPGSANYHQFISSSQFTSTYAPSEQSYLNLQHYFAGYGVTVQAASNRLAITVTGSPDKLGPAFHTTFADFQLPGGKVVYGPTSAPSVPFSLGITSAYGFTNAIQIEPMVKSLPKSASPTLPLACSGGGISPADIKGDYGVTSLPSGDTGTGEKIAVTDIYDTAEPQTMIASDLTAFDSDCSVATTTPVFDYPVPNGDYNESSGWGGETDLDVQWSHVMAPGATIVESWSPYTGMGLYQSIDYLVATDSVNVISNSWGEPEVGHPSGWGYACTFECNASTDGSYAILHPVLEAAAAEGISVFAASGDCGAADGTISPGVATNYPAGDEDVTGVGGTTLNSTSATYPGETAWTGNASGTTTSGCGNTGGAGGGWSPTPQPWYQHGYGVASKHLRGVPDVGITAGSFLDIVSSGSQTAEAGTSDASPMWAGLAAVADQIHGGGLGLINPALYTILRSADGTNYNTSFHDIKTGDNTYKAHSGWDPVTGVGTPIANVAIPAIANLGSLPVSTGLTATLTPSTTSPSTGVSVTFTAAATGGTGTYSLYDYNFGDGNATYTKSTTVTHTYALDGAYPANVEVFDSSGNSTGSAFVMISVGTTPFTLSLAASSTAPAVGAAVTFTATASGGSTPYEYYYEFGDGTWTWQNAVSSTTSVHIFHTAGVYCAQANATDSKKPHDGAESNVVVVTVGGASGTCSGGSTVSLTSVAISPTTPSVGASSATPFTATPTCSATCPGTITYAWALTSTTLGALSGSGASETFNAGTTAGTVGIYVNATLSGVTKGTSTIITVQSSPTTITSVAVSPLTPSVIQTNTQLFTATPTCSATCPGTITYVWALTSTTLGTLTGSGTTDTFTAGSTAVGTVGIYVNATLSPTTVSTSTIITVVYPTLTSVALSPTNPTVATSGTQPFTATPTCSITCPGTVTYAWALTSATLGSLSGTGATDTFTALTTAGTVGIYVNATLPNGGTKEASTIITVAAVALSSVSLSPTTPTVTSGGTQPFTATPTCSSTCPGTITYVWSVSSATLGSITGTGASVTFTAGTTPMTGGIFVNATLGTNTKEASTTITITVITLDSVALSPTTPTVTTSATQGFTATPSCSSTCPGTINYVWSVSSPTLGSITGTGASVTFTAGTTPMTGGIYVNATLGASTAEANTLITVELPNALTSVTLSPTTPAVASGSSTPFTATPLCTNTCPTTGITYTWAISSTTLGTISGAGASETFKAGTTAGTLSIYVNATYNSVTQGATTIITVNGPTLNSVSVSPSTYSMATQSTKTFTAAPACTPSCPGSGITYAWAITNSNLGSLTPNGASVIFTAATTAGTVGLFVNATLGTTTVKSSAEVTITSSVVTLNSVAISPTSPSVASGGQKTFTATPTCSSTCPSITYTWSVSSSALGSIGSSGASVTFTAGTTAMTGAIFVNATDGTTIVEAYTPVTVTVTVALVSVSVSPSMLNVSGGSQSTFTASVSCTGGATCPSGTTYSWSLSNGNGNITSSSTSSPTATFVAGNTSGSVVLTVTATLNGVEKTNLAVIIISASSTSSSGGLSSTMLLLILVAAIAVVAVVVAVILLRRKPKPAADVPQPQAAVYQPYQAAPEHPAAPPAEPWSEGTPGQ
jgi:kumamolisin